MSPETEKEFIETQKQILEILKKIYSLFLKYDNEYQNEIIFGDLKNIVYLCSQLS